jgi:hypothetical protein
MQWDINQIIDIVSEKATHIGGGGFLIGLLVWAKKNIPALLDWWLEFRMKRIDVQKKELEFQLYKKEQDEVDGDDKQSEEGIPGV